MTEPTFEALYALPELWATLQQEKRDIWLYGMGNGADKILAVLEKRGVAVRGVFASDGFVRGHAFRGMPVRSFSEVCALYPENGCVVLLAFGTARPEVLSLIARVAERYPLYVPDVPVCGEELFDKAFFTAHEAELREARACFFNDASRRIFDLVIAYKLTGRYDYLCAAVTEPDADRRILSLQGVRSMADLGAYTGDTVREMLKIAPLSYALAVEPDPRSFKKLSAFAEAVSGCTVFPHHAAVSDVEGSAAFDASGNRNAGLCTGRESVASSVKTTTVDALLGERTVDYLKYDVEGAEAAALRGSEKTIVLSRPRLKVACYHRSEDLFTLPLLLRRLAPAHRLFLTRRASVPAWDLDLLAVPHRSVPQIAL